MAQNVSSDGLPGLARQLSRTVTDAGKSQTGVPIVCYITQADNSVLQVEVEHRALAQEVLDKICKILGIVEESEYFGIQYIGGKNELLWLNNRNRLSRQVPSQPPYHLYFKVKFYIPPEDVLLEGTRHQFYINVVHQLKEGVWDSGTTLDTQSHLIALMAYVQFGRFNANTTPCKYACFWPDSRGEIPAEVIRSAANFHRSLDDFTVSQAQYELLRIVSTEVPSYGMYFYEVKDIFERRLILGVGPEGLVLCNSNYVVNDKFPYCRVHTITTSSRVVTLNLLEDDGSVKSRNYQLASPRLASSLYRSVTEVYAFFRCDSVKKEVLLQTRRDFRDTITFHHNGKEYAFDVRSTFREVFDRARRHLYHCANSTTPHGSPPNASAPICSSLMMSDSSFVPSSSETPAHRASGDAGSGLKRDYSSRAESMIGDEDIQEIVQNRLLEAGLCRVCMDAQVSRVFIPCGHIICCAECANRIELCSVCRKPIEIRHPCFLPWDPELENHMQLESHRVRRQSARSISNSSASGTFLLHTVSAPTCNLFSLPSTHCLEPVNDHAVSSSNPDASDCEILTDMNSQWATDKEEHNNFERPSSSQSDQSAAHESVTADARSSVSPSPSLANSLPLTSEHSSTLPMNTVITTGDSGGGSSEIGSTTTTVANSSRRSAHVTWQITN